MAWVKIKNGSYEFAYYCEVAKAEEITNDLIRCQMDGDSRYVFGEQDGVERTIFHSDMLRQSSISCGRDK
jgi:hypothetical protein